MIDKVVTIIKSSYSLLGNLRGMNVGACLLCSGECWALVTTLTLLGGRLFYGLHDCNAGRTDIPKLPGPPERRAPQSGRGPVPHL
eukprot:3216194-Amphidinium_carterae.1